MRDTLPVIKVGLTGGIGAGKSEVARLLADLGADVIDADALARAALAPGTPELARVVAEFGPEVLHPDGTLDRRALGSLVFGDAARLAVLNAIVHPAVAARTGARIAELEATGGADGVIVHDVPLLVENGLAGNYDVVVVVEAAPETQLRRLAQSRGMSRTEAEARIRTQATPAQRRAVADVIIDNDGDREHLRAQVHQLWQRLTTAA